MARQTLIGISLLVLLSGAAHAANKAVTTQKGDGNTAVVDQLSGANGTVLIQQIGNSNDARSTQGGSGNYDVSVQNGNGNTIKNDSSGFGNRSEIRQGCPVSLCGASLMTNNNSATVTQTSTSASNANSVFQYPGSSGLGGDNTVTVTQRGNGGNAGNPAPPPLTPGGYTILNSDLLQYGTDSTIRVDQAGDGQRATVYQGVAFDTAANPPGFHVASSPDFYDLYGMTINNSASVTQNATAGFAQAFVYQGASDNVATVTQSGTSQFAEIRQSTQESGISVGEGANIATVTQDLAAIGAISFVFQQGAGNTATVRQTKAGANSSVYQSGSGNVATITQ